MPDFTSGGASRREFLMATGGLSAGMLAGQVFGAQENIPLAPPDKQPPDLVLPEVVEHKVRWAIVGLGKLALEEVLPAFSRCKRSQLVALVSGHPEKAQHVARAYGLHPKKIYSYDNYDRLSENNEVDVVYIILPNSMHAEYTIRAHQAGKHVLCEKPMAGTASECEQMIAAAAKAQRKLMVAYRLRYEPFNRQVIDMCREGKIGDIKTISSSNSQVVAAPNIRLSSALKGGPLGDVGIYCLNAARYITQAEPLEVTAFSDRTTADPRFREVPETVSFQLRFPRGIQAHCSCSFNASESRFYRIEGTKGVLELDQAFAYRGQTLWLRTADGDHRLKVEPVDHFAAEMDHLSECIMMDRAPLTPGEEGLADMRAISAIEEAAATARTVTVKQA